MTVIKRGKSYWIDIGFNRRRIRKRSPDNTHKGAKNYELFLRQKISKGESFEKKEQSLKYTFKEFALVWLKNYVENNNKPSECEIRRYILNSTLIPYFGKKFIDEISSYDIENYKNLLQKQRKLAPKSINNYLSILSMCLKTSIDWNMNKNLPRIKFLKVAPQKYDFLTEEEMESLLKNSEGIWHDMILLALKTGLRFGEIIALRWVDVNFKNQSIIVCRNIVRGYEGSPKNNRIRTVPLTVSVIQMLNVRNKNSEYIFHSLGKPLKYNYCRRKLHEECQKSNIRYISWHVLRHTFATHLAVKGVSVFSIKELLGHSDIKMTMRYSHPNFTMLRSAIEALEPVLHINGTITSQIESTDKILAKISD